MSVSALVLLGFIGWMLLLIITMEVMRSFLVFSGRWDPDKGFRPDGSDVSPFAHRLARAHANCYESFPIIGGLLLLAILTGNTAVTDPLAPWLLAARLGQSGIHLLSATGVAAYIRPTLFFVQLLIAAWWAIGLLMQWVGG